MAKANNERVKMYERLSRLEESAHHHKEKLNQIEIKLDEVRLTIEKWKGTFTFIASVGGIVGGAIVSFLLKFLGSLK